MEIRSSLESLHGAWISSCVIVHVFGFRCRLASEHSVPLSACAQESLPCVATCHGTAGEADGEEDRAERASPRRQCRLCQVWKRLCEWNSRADGAYRASTYDEPDGRELFAFGVRVGVKAGAA